MDDFEDLVQVLEAVAVAVVWLELAANSFCNV